MAAHQQNPAKSEVESRGRWCEPIIVDTLQVCCSQLFAALKIAMRKCFDNVINALSSHEVCCDAVLHGDIAYNYGLWRFSKSPS